MRTLETLAPDVVTLHECWRDRSGQDQAAHLARALGYHSAYGGGTFLAEDWATGSALLSRWPIEHHEHREFPASAPERWGGSALFGRIAGSGFWGGQRPSLAHYVTGWGPGTRRTPPEGVRLRSRSRYVTSPDRIFCATTRSSRYAMMPWRLSV